MNEIEKYEFDLNGYLLINGLLDERDVQACLAAADQLESHIAEHIDAEPRREGFSHIHYRFDEEYDCFSYKSQSGGGLQYVVDDFLNASSAFDVFVGHEPTMKYVEELAAGPFKIGNSELRYRYQSNTTPTHMGGRMDARNQFEFVGRKMYDSGSQQRQVRDFDLLAVRVLYALHDIPVENGPLCVVPGTHKSNYFSPYSDDDPTQEPGMIPVPMKAGDAIIFTENIRHGGFPNLLATPRKTIHLMFAPAWVGSQSPVHWNDRVHVSEKAWARYSDRQRALLPAPSSALEIEYARLQDEISRLSREQAKISGLNREHEDEIARLNEENANLQEKIRALESAIAAIPPPRSLLSTLVKPFRR